MNQYLQDFYQAWWDWVEGGCGDNEYGFTVEMGLCSALCAYSDLMGWTDEEFHEKYSTMVYQFHQCFLNPIFPFNENGREFAEESDKTKNDLRTSFVWMNFPVKKRIL